MCKKEEGIADRVCEGGTGITENIRVLPIIKKNNAKRFVVHLLRQANVIHFIVDYTLPPKR